jgi:DNA adenine methylase
MDRIDARSLRSPFGYPGGKAYLAPWIIDHLPSHDAYVEPFAGSAAVLVQKPLSGSEVINDKDGDVVQFFRALRDQTDELVSWLQETPYARDTHRRFANQFYAGFRPDDPVERAGRFFYLRYSQFAGKYRTKSGFSSSAKRDQAAKFRNATKKLEAVADRLRSVQVENRDWREMFERFSAENTVWYCDPPYVGPGDSLYSHDGSFDHSEFVAALDDLEGDWIVSYEEIPDDLEPQVVVKRSRTQYMAKNHEDADDHGTERLALSFDPATTPMFVNDSTTQQKLVTATDGGNGQSADTGTDGNGGDS